MRKQKVKRKMDYPTLLGRALTGSPGDWLSARQAEKFYGGIRRGEMAIFMGFSTAKERSKKEWLKR